MAETEESGSDGPSTKEAKIGRRTFTVSSRPRRTSSLLGKADGIGLMPSGERCSPSPQPLVEEQLRDKKRQSAAAKEKEIAKEILEVTKVDKKENGKGLRPPTHIPKKSSVINNKETAFKTVSSANKSPPSASVAKKQAKVPNSVIPVVTKNSDKDKVTTQNLYVHDYMTVFSSRRLTKFEVQIWSFIPLWNWIGVGVVVLPVYSKRYPRCKGPENLHQSDRWIQQSIRRLT